MITYTPNPATYHATADVIDDGDEPKAAVLAPGIEAALDNAAYLRGNRGATVGAAASGSPLATINSATHTDIQSITLPSVGSYNTGRVEAHAVFNVSCPTYTGAIQPVIKQVGGTGDGAEVELTESVVEFSDCSIPVPCLVYLDMSDVAALGPFTADATSFELVFRGWIPGFVGGPDTYDVLSAKVMARVELY